MAGLERCEDILSLFSPTSVSQRNPIIIWSWEKGNFTFNGDRRTKFSSNILHSSSWMMVSLSFASSETLGRRQTIMLLKHLWVLPCFYSMITLTAHIQSVFFYHPHMFPWSTAQLFSIHIKIIAHMFTRFLILSSLHGIANSNSEVQNVHLSFIKLFLTDFRPSLQFKRPCWNHCCQSCFNFAPQIK